MLAQVHCFSTWVKVQITGKKATQVEVKVLPKNVLEVQVQSKQLYLKYRKKYFINSEPFLIKTFNIQICFYSLMLCPDMPHGADRPYPIRILAFFEMIRPYHVVIRISGNLWGGNCKSCSKTKVLSSAQLHFPRLNFPTDMIDRRFLNRLV